MVVLFTFLGCMRPGEPNGGAPKSKALWTGDEPSDGSGWAKCTLEPTCAATIQPLAHHGRLGGRGLNLHVEESKWVAAAWFYPDSLSTAGIDITQFDALSFWMRLSAKNDYNSPSPDGFWISLAGSSAQLSSGQLINACGREVIDGWRHVIIPVTNFAPIPSKSWSRQNVTGLSIYTAMNGSYAFDLDLDDITFEELDSKALQSLCSPPPRANPELIVANGTLAIGSPDSISFSGQCPNTADAACVEASVGGSDRAHKIDSEAVQQAVQAEHDHIRECYAAGLMRHPGLCGDARFEFTIDETGHPQYPKAISGTTLPDCDVVKCIADRLSELQFPKPEGGAVTIVYPLKFVP